MSSEQPALELTFLGHQTWLISRNQSHVLLDPVLGNSFGHSDELDFRVYPPRDIDLARMPVPDAMVLSHEHLDHFHLPSIDRLPRSAPFYVGTLMPRSVSDAIEALGFQVHRVDFGEPFQVGDLELTLFAASAETVFWEKRVTQVYAVPCDARELGVFIGVDAILAESFLDRLGAGMYPPLRGVVVANNSQQVPPGALGAYSNLLPMPPERTTERSGGRFPGLSILHAVMQTYLEDVPGNPDVILCGSGFLSMSAAFGPFLFSDNQRLAALANELSMTARAHGPLPGEKVTLRPDDTEVSAVGWVTLNKAMMSELLAQQAAFLRSPKQPPFEPIMGAFASDREAEEARAQVEAELAFLGRALLISKVGMLAVHTDEYLDGPLGPRRILFRFLGGPGGAPCQYAFDFAASCFVPVDTPVNQALTTYPFGVEMYLKDFVAVLDGRLQIWEVGGARMRAWFVGPVYESVVSFLFEQYGEQVRQDLAARLYERAIQRLKTRSHTA